MLSFDGVNYIYNINIPAMQYYVTSLGLDQTDGVWAGNECVQCLNHPDRVGSRAATVSPGRTQSLLHPWPKAQEFLVALFDC